METNIGPYQLQGQLGAGGMGEVYRALDTRMGRHVALKILPESLAHDSERRRRFEQEARLAASLNHPNVMAIYDVGLDQHPPYIVGELVPGESLRALMEKGPLAPRKAIDLAAQIAAGLAAAHAAGIVHRDLKPENVIVTPEGSAKILDFGVARMETRGAGASETVTFANTTAGSVVGTAAYMSPEQARAEEVDYRSDQFALGLVLHEMLSGKHPFARPSAVQTMSAIIQDDAPPIDRPIPAQLRWIVDRCLSKERAGRYESTRDLARELAYLRDRFSEVTGQQPAISASAPAPGRRRAGPAAIAVLLGALAGGAAVWCAAALLRDPGEVDLSRYHLTPFATTLDDQGGPSWSPDGKSIAFFGDNESQPAQLWVQAVDGATAVAVTRPGANVLRVFQPIWSPDSRLLYVRCAVNGSSAICRVPAGGGEPVVVQEKATFAALSPDGTLLTTGYSTSALRAELFTANPPDAPRRPYLPEPPMEGRQYFNNPSVAFSPDGSKIFFSIALEGRGERSWLLPWPAGNARAVFPKAVPFAFTPQMVWLPDSRHVIFAGSTAAKPSELFMADTASGRYWPVLTQDRGVSFPTVSPDGSRIAYQSNLSHSDLVSVPLSDGPARTLLSSSRSEQMVDVSPVASQMVYVTDRRGPQEIWLTGFASNIAGPRPEHPAEQYDRPIMTPAALTVDGQPAQFFMNPVFSPDGRRVAFAAKTHAGVQLYTVFASGGAPVRATTGDGVFENAPTWSPDGNWLAFGRETKSTLTLSKVRPGSGEAVVDIAPWTGSTTVPEWSPSGEWIALHNNQGQLALISPDGKNTRTLEGDSGPVAWSRDSKTIYQARNEPPALFAIDVATGKARQLRAIEGLAPFTSLNPGLRISLTPDGKSVVYTVNRPRREIWILDGLQTPRPWAQRLMGR